MTAVTDVAPDPAATPPQSVKLVNLPNSLTVLRLAVVPLFAALLLQDNGLDDAGRYWATVFILPPRLAAMTPCRITHTRSRVTASSRTRITTVTHHGSSSRIDSPIRAVPVSALSAIGSASLPNSVT